MSQTATPETDVTTKRKRRTPRPARSLEPSRYKLEDIDWILTQTGWSMKTLDRRIADDDFPRPVEGSAGRKRKWTRDQYERWAKSKQDEAMAG